jgi:hypothetical protein
MIDSVSRGYITPAEAYDALKAKYFPIVLETRSSYRRLPRKPVRLPRGVSH